jgi:hypothetical protein
MLHWHMWYVLNRDIFLLSLLQCMCSECAKVLRYQTTRCPICRQPVERLLEIKVSSKTEDQQQAPQSPPLPPPTPQQEDVHPWSESALRHYMGLVCGPLGLPWTLLSPIWATGECNRHFTFSICKLLASLRLADPCCTWRPETQNAMKSVYHIHHAWVCRGYLRKCKGDSSCLMDLRHQGK